jgi:hypothetical protein
VSFLLGATKHPREISWVLQKHMFSLELLKAVASFCGVFPTFRLNRINVFWSMDNLLM